MGKAQIANAVRKLFDLPPTLALALRRMSRPVSIATRVLHASRFMPSIAWHGASFTVSYLDEWIPLMIISVQLSPFELMLSGLHSCLFIREAFIRPPSFPSSVYPWTCANSTFIPLTCQCSVGYTSRRYWPPRNGPSNAS